jgi:hypothetical protein
LSLDTRLPEERALSGAKMEDGRIVETAREARGAERGPTVRNVLVAGTALVIAARDHLHRVFRRREVSGSRTCPTLRAALRRSLHPQRGDFARGARLI